jgi:hypothetical protein
MGIHLVHSWGNTGIDLPCQNRLRREFRQGKTSHRWIIDGHEHSPTGFLRRKGQHHPTTKGFFVSNIVTSYERRRIHHCTFHAVQLTSVKFEIRLVISPKAPAVSGNVFQPREAIDEVSTRSHPFDEMFDTLFHPNEVWIIDGRGA